MSIHLEPLVLLFFQLAGVIIADSSLPENFSPFSSKRKVLTMNFSNKNGTSKKLCSILMALAGGISIPALGRPATSPVGMSENRDHSADITFQSKISRLADEFQLSLFLKSSQQAAPATAAAARDLSAEARRSDEQPLDFHHDPDCRPNAGSCIDAVCRHASSYECDDRSELAEVAAACRGNYDGGCVDQICSGMPAYQCDDRSEGIEIARACQGAYGNCVQAAYHYVSSYQVDDRSEGVEIARACSGSDGSCVESIASRLPSYETDDRQEFIAIAHQCSGR
jgi:hypothetical protein